MQAPSICQWEFGECKVRFKNELSTLKMPTAQITLAKRVHYLARGSARLSFSKAWSSSYCQTLRTFRGWCAGNGLQFGNVWPILSKYVCIYLSIYLSICLSIYLHLHLHLHIYPYPYLSISIHIYPYPYLFISISYLSISIHIYPYQSLSIHIYPYPSISISVHICPYLSLSPSLSLSIASYLYLSLSIYLYLSLSTYIYLYIYIYMIPSSAREVPPPLPNGMGPQVAPPLPFYLFASYWQHFGGPASYLLGVCSDSDYQPPIY